MLSKSSIVGATAAAAAAVMSNLPFVYGVGKASPVGNSLRASNDVRTFTCDHRMGLRLDDQYHLMVPRPVDSQVFPPITGEGIEADGFGLKAVCQYGSGTEGTEDWSSLKIAIKNVKPGCSPYAPVHRRILTQSIACPKRNDEQGAFVATFEDEHHNNPGYLHTCKGHFDDPDEHYVFKFRPPQKARMDPLLDLDNTTFSHIIERFDEFFGYLGLGAEPTHDYFRQAPRESRIDVSKLGVVYDVMKDFCPLVGEAVRKHSKTFADLCHQTFTICKEAIALARNEDWKFFPRGNITYVLSPGSEEREIDAEIMYLF